MATLLLYHSPIFSLIMMEVGAEDWELGWSAGLLAASCWQGVVVWGKILRLLCPGGGPHSSLWTVLERLIPLEVQLVMIQGRKLKSRRARNIGITMGISQENHCEVLFPRGFQESSTSFLCFSVSWEVLPLGVPIELDSSGCCENDQMRAGPLKSQWRG
jgi:hypothetical protein